MCSKESFDYKHIIEGFTPTLPADHLSIFSALLFKKFYGYASYVNGFQITTIVVQRLVTKAFTVSGPLCPVVIQVMPPPSLYHCTGVNFRFLGCSWFLFERSGWAFNVQVFESRASFAVFRLVTFL